MPDSENANNINGNGVSYFSRVQTPFPDIIDDKIDTVIFLKASKDVVSLVEKLGNVFTPVKYDMNGNIEKIERKYNTDQMKHKYVNDMLLIEKNEGQNVTIDALQWLRRALHFLVRFFECIVDDFDRKNKNGSMSQALKAAYTDTLHPYHNWMSRQLFSLLCRMCPTRQSIFHTLAMDEFVHEEIIITDMISFKDRLKSNVLHLHSFYIEHSIEDARRV